jgi:phage terminase small subunit
LDIDKDPKVLAFLDALASCGQVTQAARAAGISPKTAYRWRQAYPALAPRWAAALDQGLDSLEDEAVRRAFEGSDRLLMFVLNRRRPEVYNAHRAKSQVAGTTKHVIDFNNGRRLPKDDLRDNRDSRRCD